MRRRERGAVLILVLGLVALLTAVAVDMASRAKIQTLRALRLRRDHATRRIIESGAEIAGSLLRSARREGFAYWGQSWNRSVDFTLGDGEHGRVSVEDESGKLNLPFMVRSWEKSRWQGTVRRLFEYLRKTDKQQGDRWLQAEGLVMARLEESPALLTLDGFREGGLSSETVFGHGGLATYLTCFGDGRINLNTAPAAVLYALHEGLDEAIVSEILSRRGGGQAEDGAAVPFRDIRDALLPNAAVAVRPRRAPSLLIPPNVLSQITGLLKVDSMSFSARVDIDAYGRRRIAWVFFAGPPGAMPQRILAEEIEP